MASSQKFYSVLPSKLLLITVKWFEFSLSIRSWDLYIEVTISVWSLVWSFWSGAQLGKEAVRPPLHFFENQKSALILGKKGPDSVHFWVKYSIQNIVVRVSRRKNSKIYPVGPFFLVFLTKFLSKCTNCAKPSLPWKISGYAPVD